MRKYIISGFVGALCMAITLCSTTPQATESEEYQHLDFITEIEKNDCFVCSNSTDSPIAQYWNEDNIGILNLNTFELMYIEINRYNDNT